MLELRAIKKARDWGLKNIIPMLPFCRSPEEAQKIMNIMESEGLKRGQDGLKVYVMAEIPSNIICADIFSPFFDGFSIGSNDLTQLTYGVGRDNEKMIPLMNNYNYNTNSEAIRRSVSHLIKTAHEFGRKVGICGQAPSDDPDFLRFLVRESIDSLSLNFDTFARGRINTWRTEVIEAKLDEKNKVKSYEFLNECDKLIENVRVPRGKLRNMVRKQGKSVDLKLIEKTKEYDEKFNDIEKIAFNFVSRIDQGKIDDFISFFTNYQNQIKDIGGKIPRLKRDIREFGIY